ncbi:hypothetical protein [Roseiflexus castenholzii]|uniref:hypothetical protein n=1 Tax=Roseiflexus castenholzii TaxID=120962 RepID=UPI003C7A3990
MDVHTPQHAPAEDLTFKENLDLTPIRSFETMEQRIALLLHGFVPILTLIWSLVGAYWMWQSTFGSGWMAVIAVLAIESIGIFGMALTALDLTESRFWRRLRFVLPIIPSFSFAYLIHDRVTTSAVWLAPMSQRLGMESDHIAWGATAGLVALITAISWWSWRAFEEALIHPESMRKRAIYRDYMRRQRALDVQQYEIALRKDELSRQRAAMMAKIEAAIQVHENRMVEMFIELRASRSALAQLRASRDALMRDASLSHDHRELPDSGRLDLDDGEPSSLNGQPDSGDAITDLIDQSNGASAKDKMDLAIALYHAGFSLRRIERELGISRRTIQRRIDGGNGAVAARNRPDDASKDPGIASNGPDGARNGHNPDIISAII